MYDQLGVDFYPTPFPLALKMISKLHKLGGVVLDPAAGKGDLFEAFSIATNRYFRTDYKCKNSGDRRFGIDIEAAIADYESGKIDLSSMLSRSDRTEFRAIEISPSLQSILRGKGYTVIGSDFMRFDGMDQPDIILANVPFSIGAEFTLRILDFLYSGQAVIVLNAESLKNPCTLVRQELVKRLERLNAEVEYLEGQFVSAERPTGVEVALISVVIERKIEDEIFKDMKATDSDFIHVDDDQFDSREVNYSSAIKSVVAEYDSAKRKGIELIMDFAMKSKTVPFFNLTQEGVSAYDDEAARGNLTKWVKLQSNQYLKSLRKRTWKSLMDRPQFSRYLTQSKRAAFLKAIEQYSSMDVCEENIAIFIAEISAGYSDTLKSAALEMFDKLTYVHAYYTETVSNVYGFTGWKSQDAFKISKKQVIPNMRAYSSWSPDKLEPRPDGHIRGFLDDLEKIASYFDGGSLPEVSAIKAVEDAMALGQSKKILSTRFEINLYKKGTLHVRWLNEDIRRRFNIFAAGEKGWLPCDYGKRDFKDMSPEEKAFSAVFEEGKAYKVDHGVNPFESQKGVSGTVPDLLKLAA